MLSAPSAYPIPQFAAQRVRGAEAVVEQSHRRPVKVIRMVFFMLTFSERGVLDTDALMQQAAAPRPWESRNVPYSNEGPGINSDGGWQRANSKAMNSNGTSKTRCVRPQVLAPR